MLDLAALFYTHLAEVTSWLENLRRHLMEDLNIDSGSVTVEEIQVILCYFSGLEASEIRMACGHLQGILEQMALRKDSTVEGCLNTLAEGSALIEQLRLVDLIIKAATF